jgi:hypothetical protein
MAGLCTRLHPHRLRHPLCGRSATPSLSFIAVVKKTFRFRDAFFVTTAYATILFSERNDDKRYKSDLIFSSWLKHMQLYDILQEMELNSVCLQADSLCRVNSETIYNKRKQC